MDNMIIYAKRRYLILIGIFLLITYMYLAGSVSKTISDDDIQAISLISNHVDCGDIDGFNGQLRCVRSIQVSLKDIVPDMKCASRGILIEPADFMNRKYGCCYDRARFLEKALWFYGLQTRHVALYDMSKYGLFAALIPGVPSHATLEVKTTRGWMGVDSNELFVLLTRGGEPFSYKNLSDKLMEVADSVRLPGFYKKPFLVIYGLYSRHGMFHGRNMPAPEVNYHDFIAYNIFD